MINMLMENGFIKSDNENIWVKKNWTIRFFDGEIEVFNNPLYNILGKYHRCSKTPLNLSLIIDDVNSFIEEGI